MLAAVMSVCIVRVVVETAHWPLVGDDALNHYLVFLMQHGMAPYRQVVDVQMPGTLLLDWGVMDCIGSGAIALRVFDFSLMALAIFAMVVIAWPYDRYAGFLAGGMFALLHARDGLVQAGERDQVITVLLLLGFAAAFQSVRRRSAWLLFFASFFVAAAGTIKPTAVPFAVMLLGLTLLALYRRKASLRWYWVAAGAGIVLPAASVLIFLVHERSLHAFLRQLQTIWPYYASRGRLPLGALLGRLVESFLWPWVLLWLLLRLTRRKTALRDLRYRWEFVSIYSALVLAMVAFCVQGKAFPYHRYPLLGFLLPIMFVDFAAAVHNPGAVRKAAGVCGLLYSVCWLAPVCLHRIAQLDWRDDDYYHLLSADLKQLGGSSLSGQVQCLDMIAGCNDALYRMHLVQSTGFTADLFLWGPPGSDDHHAPPAVLETRARFLQAILAHPPKVFVVTKQNYLPVPGDTNTYQKLERWPTFDRYLAGHYHLWSERTLTRGVRWSDHDEYPPGYRIYVRGQEPLSPTLALAGSER